MARTTKAKEALAEAQEWIDAAKEEVAERETALVISRQKLEMHQTIYAVLEKTFMRQVNKSNKSAQKPTRQKVNTKPIGKRVRQLRQDEPQPPRCVACYEIKDHANHGTGEGQHEFSTDLTARLTEGLKRYEATCTHVPDDGAGVPCDLTKDSVIHDKSMGYGGYHEFVGREAQVAAGS